MSVAVALAEDFARELAAWAADHKRKTLTHAEYRDVFLAAAPHLRTSPDRDAHLTEALAELEERRLVRATKSHVRNAATKLPSEIALLGRADPRVAVSVAHHSWRPELAFARQLTTLRRSEFEALVAIQAFLLKTVPSAGRVPTAERSLQVFGDEKRLDALLANRRLFGEGRVTLEMLRAYRCPPPFVYTPTGPGPAALVIENAATYDSVLRALPRDGRSPIGLVAFGGGNAFVATVGYFAELVRGGKQIEEIRYFGDLDTEGLRVPVNADRVALTLGVPRVLPANALWVLLLAHGRPSAHQPIRGSTARKLVTWLPIALQAEAAAHLEAGSRLAQEAVSLDLLLADDHWTTSHGLGLGENRPLP